MHLFIKNHIVTKENLFYQHVNEFNYNLEDDNEGDKIDYQIYQMFNYYLYLLDKYKSMHLMCIQHGHQSII